MREKINRWLELKRYNWKNLDISLLVVVSILLLIIPTFYPLSREILFPSKDSCLVLLQALSLFSFLFLLTTMICVCIYL